MLGVIAALAAPAPIHADPVDDLREALAIDDVSAPTDAMVQFRRENLQKKVDALKKIGQLRRALALDQWRDDPSRFDTVSEKIVAVDAEKRAQIGKRLTMELEQGAKSEDPNNRIAVANVVAEIGPSVRALNSKEKGGFARGLLPLVERLAKDSDLGVRQEALRALGSLNGPANEVSRRFADVLKNDPASGPRRIAADGLAQQVRIVNYLNRPGRTATGVEASRAEVLDTLIAVLQTSPLGFRDSDPQVRALSAEAFQLVALTLSSDLIKDVFPRKDLPPAGRPLAEKERDVVSKSTQELSIELKELRPVLSAMRDHIGAVAPLLSDSELRVRLMAMEALTYAAKARQRLRQRVFSLPDYPDSEVDHVKLLEGSDPLETFLEKDLASVAPLFSESNPRMRRAAAIFLMMLEDRALPLVEVLTASLTDPERTIRGIAARALADLPPAKITGAVPNLARLLSDPDLNLRMTAAATLEGMGPLARGAVGAMAQAVTQGDAEGRIAVMQALIAVGPDAAQAAVPHLTGVLGQRDADASVLVIAAETLAQLGSPAREAIPALRRLIGHEEAEVRAAASEAILAINQPAKK